MRTRLSVTVATVGFLASVAHAAPPPAVPKVGGYTGVSGAVQGAASVPASPLYPIDAQLSTVVDHPGEFGGQLVRLRSVRVERVLSATLVKLKDAREHGPYHFHIYYHPDKLFAVLPAAARVAQGDVLNITGSLRTVRGAALTKETVGNNDDVLKHGNLPVLVATSVATIDGTRLDAPR